MAQSFLEDIPASRLTQDTIRRIYELIDQAKTDPKFQDLVYAITKGTQNKDYMGEIAKIFKWVKKNIRYTRDPYGVELVQDVWSTLDRGRGDCDDMDVIVGAMVEVMGAPVRLITVSTRKDREPCHTYPEAFVNKRFVPLDVTVASSFPGWKPVQGITDRIVWTRRDVGIAGFDLENVEGVGDWKASVQEVNLTPGIPNDIAHTYADLHAGETLISRQNLPDGKITFNLDRGETPKPGDLPYDPALPIRDFPTYRQMWSFMDRSQVPTRIDPWGHMRPWSKNKNAIFPEKTVPEENLMSNVSGLHGLALGEVSDADITPLVGAIQRDVTDWVQKRKIQPHQAEDHAKKLVDAVTGGDVGTVKAHPETAKVVTQIARKYQGRAGGRMFVEPSMAWIPNESGQIYRQPGGVIEQGMGEFGDIADGEKEEIVSAIHDDITAHVRAGNIPKEAAATAAAKTVDALKTGDKKVLRATPKTAQALKRISDRRSGKAGIPGTSRTPATAPHHPVSADMVRGAAMRDKSYDYYTADESLNWIPALYGMGDSPTGAVDPRILTKVHTEVMRILPGELHKRGLARHHHRHPRPLPGESTRGNIVTPRAMQGLGQLSPQETQAAATLSTNIAAAITGVVDPADSAAINKAVATGVNAALGVAAPAPGLSFNLSGWGVPVAVIAVLGTAAYLMTGKKKSGPRRNPSRRRRGGGGGGKGGKSPLLLWGLGAVAAYLILKPKAPAIPGAPASSGGGILSTIANLFKPSASGAPGAGTQVVGAAAKGISSLFSSSPTPPAGTTTGKDAYGNPISIPPPSSDISPIITTLPGETPAPPDSGFVVDTPS